MNQHTKKIIAAALAIIIAGSLILSSVYVLIANFMH